MKESVSLRPGACCWLTEQLGGGHVHACCIILHAQFAMGSTLITLGLTHSTSVIGLNQQRERVRGCLFDFVGTCTMETSNAI